MRAKMRKIEEEDRIRQGNERLLPFRWNKKKLKGVGYDR